MKKINKEIILSLFFVVLALPSVMGAASFAVNSFSCTPSEVVMNDVFSCTAQIRNTGDAAGAVSVATLYPDSNNWLEDSNYPQASGISVDPGQTTEVTFSGLRSVKTGSNGFSKVMLDDVTDTYVDDNHIEVNVIDVVVTVSESDTTVAMSDSFDSSAEVTAGGNIDVSLTFSVSSGGCSIGNQDATKTISNMQDGNKQSRTWSVTQGTSGDCKYTITASATGESEIATTSDSSSRTVTCTDCPTGSGSSSSSSGSGGGGGGGGGATSTVVYSLGELVLPQAVSLGVNEQATFSIFNAEHKLVVTELTETEATITVESEAQTFNLVVGGVRNIDLNGDELAEVSIKLQSINIISNKATLVITPTAGESIPAGVGEEDSNSATEEETKDIGDIFERGNKFIWIIISFALVLVIIVILYLRKNKAPKYKPYSAKKKRAYVFIAVGLILVAGFLVYYDSQQAITGKAIEESEDVKAVGESDSCTDSDSGLAYFVKGKVERCSDGICLGDEDYCSGNELTEWHCVNNEKISTKHECEVCNAGACVNVARDYDVSTWGWGGGGGSGGGSGGGTNEVVVNAGETYNLGEIGIEETLEVSVGDNIVFTFNGESYLLHVDGRTDTSATLSLGGTLTVGEERALDLNADGENDIYIRLRSVNVLNGKIKLTLRPVAF